MFERYRLILTHEMVFPGGNVQRIGEPLCCTYSVDRDFSKRPIVLNTVLDGFKNEVLSKIAEEIEDA